MIEIERLTACAGDFRLTNVSLRVPAGAYAVLMGPTGCGKTTLLEAVCGLREVESGVIRLGGRDVTRAPVNQRGVGYVPQDGAVFPRMSVRQNLGFALAVKRTPKNDIDARVEQLASSLQLTPLLNRRATSLSGGESQRVALARALAAEPGVLLLDEPLTGLDEPTRDQLTELLAGLNQVTCATVLHVTHSQREAERLGQLRLEMLGREVVVRHADPAILEVGGSLCMG